ncbi:FtsX-like permease family protein [bacterium]|nr:FtsX-like permease family protein [bacterium]
MRLLPFDYAVRNLTRSPRRLAAILLGNALVVLLIIAAAAFVEGMRNTLTPARDSRNVIILGAGSEESIERSEIAASSGGVIAASIPGILTVGGAAHVSPEIVSALLLQAEPTGGTELRAIVRGITPGAYLVHQQVEITEGRAPVGGSNEIMVGSLAEAKLGLPAGRLAIGNPLWFEGAEWRVVGHFKAKGTVMDAEIWIPLNDLLVATKRDTISCVVVTLATAEFADVDAFTKMRVDLELAAVRESDYYASLQHFYRPVAVMIWVTAILVALAGVLGGLNTLYAAFAARVREIGMLQSLGFSRRAIVTSLVGESLIASAVAVLLAFAVASALLDGVAISFSMGVFTLTINAVVLAAGATTGLLLGLLGALPPAWRCLRLAIPESLKSA